MRTVGMLGGSWREIPLFFIAIILMGFIATGYLDDYLLVVTLGLLIVFIVYLRSNYLRRKNQIPLIKQ